MPRPQAELQAAQRQNDCIELATEIIKEVAKFVPRDRDTADYSYLGTLGKVAEDLKETLSFLKGEG
jgi:hypothetical protein